MEDNNAKASPSAKRLPKSERRNQLLAAALQILRDEGGDRLTLGRVAVRAGVSKPVVYDHFGTRSGLLIELYRSIDAEHADALRVALAAGARDIAQTAELLATAYIHCSADTNGEWQALGAALAGSDEMGAVHQEILDGYVQLFASTLAPYCDLAPAGLERRCVGLIGAAEALSVAMLRGRCSEADAAAELADLILGAVTSSDRSDPSSAR